MHVVPAVIPSADLETGEILSIGGPVPVTVDGSTIRYGGADVVEPDLQASNGRIHVIDAVAVGSA